MSSVQQVANAQVFVPPVLSDQFLSNVTTNNGGTPSSSEDLVTINCDMLRVGSNPNPLKTIAWDEGYESMTTHIYFEDYAGNQTIVDLQGVSPDIVLGDSKDKPGTNYRAAVIYIDPSNRVRIDFYELRNLGTTSFAAIHLPQSFPLSGSLGQNQQVIAPHIDMWSDAFNPIKGYPAMYEFAVSWEENNYIYYNWGNIATPIVIGAGGLRVDNFLTYRRYNDVACYTDIQQNNRRIAAFTYLEANNLVVRELNFSSANPTTGAPLHNNQGLGMWAQSPRIEAMNQYSPGAVGITPWEVVATQQLSCWVFDKTGVPTDISSALLTGGNFKSTAIAAGVGNMPGEPVIGNAQFTPGYFEWNNMVAPPRYYARGVDAVFGILDPNYYIVNTNAVFGMPQYFLADVSRSLALSNCSNSGDYLLSAWYDGQDINATGGIWYKLSPNNFNPTVFKKTPVAGLDGSKPVVLYPNPASDKLYADNVVGHYKIYGLSGIKLIEGEVLQGKAIDVSMLSMGMYLLEAEGKSYKFTKQ